MGAIITFILLACVAAVGFFGFAIADGQEPMPTIQDSSLVQVLRAENDRVSKLFLDCQMQNRPVDVIRKDGKYFGLIELKHRDFTKEKDLGI